MIERGENTVEMVKWAIELLERLSWEEESHVHIIETGILGMLRMKVNIKAEAISSILLKITSNMIIQKMLALDA